MQPNSIDIEDDFLLAKWIIQDDIILNSQEFKTIQDAMVFMSERIIEHLINEYKGLIKTRRNIVIDKIIKE